MGWPPKVGELLPRADEAVGVRERLVTYSLDSDHADGSPKARGFALILGISLDSIDYLEAEIHAGILQAPVKSIRSNPPYGTNCVVEFPLRGVGRYSERVVPIRTIWEIAAAGSPPRLVSAFLRAR
jgi:hypothetical protein